jgi:hypothetical protein
LLEVFDGLFIFDIVAAVRKALCLAVGLDFCFFLDFADDSSLLGFDLDFALEGGVSYRVFS